ncbi:MAG: triose-phosphate isomerase [Acidobacteriota bacterium]
MNDRPIRTPVVAANWKMNLLSGRAEENCRALREGLEGETPEVVVFPSFPLLPAVARALDGSPAAWGGQDLHPEDEGAHTGDVSGPQLADAGCSWALAGHSERRHDHGESDGLVARKVDAALRNGLAPMICVGETKSERDAGETFDVLDRQLGLAVRPLGEAGSPPAPFALAYEPVWAIGTGDTATPETAEEAHAFLRKRLAEHLGEEAARATRILYGGSVKPGNAAELIARKDVDGFLVGGASLDAEKFLAIIGCCD